MESVTLSVNPTKWCFNFVTIKQPLNCHFSISLTKDNLVKLSCKLNKLLSKITRIERITTKDNVKSKVYEFNEPIECTIPHLKNITGLIVDSQLVLGANGDIDVDFSINYEEDKFIKIFSKKKTNTIRLFANLGKITTEITEEELKELEQMNDKRNREAKTYIKNVELKNVYEITYRYDKILRDVLEIERTIKCNDYKLIVN